MVMMMKTQNDHNSDNFEATFSRFYMVIDLNDTYKMMMMMTTTLISMMMIIMMMKIQNCHNVANFEARTSQTGHNSNNFEAATSKFCMVIDINDTYRLYIHSKS